eukprot:COSAG02_NODE_2961_length_7649_cov_39.990066_2_plen_55_part_00
MLRKNWMTLAAWQRVAEARVDPGFGVAIWLRLHQHYCNYLVGMVEKAQQFVTIP